MGKRKFKVGDKAKVKNIKFRGEDAKDANAVRGKIGTVVEIDPNYYYPYEIHFYGYWTNIMFKASQLDKVERK